ncbi:efflux RND transporter permease subunit [Chitinivibrio alkaliphilus]|uniref:Efflux transporter n=1 Tax=Chitinivibrio alkaliphilus ACht1 TaxID=1313304 RepID=U7DAC7_9BACT|nr:efflux RND transporter permease subunit [Chitinivibrio alkaliphilus]ERP31345.1 efflux transporter [Chitinivibrio alkaliphilus ACht1]
MPITHKIVAYLIKYRLIIACAVFLGTLFFGVGLTRLEIDNDTMKSVPRDLEEYQQLVRLEEEFTSPFTLLALLTFPEDSPYSLHERIEMVEHFGKQYGTLSITDAPAFSSVAHIGSLHIPKRVGGIVPRISGEPLVDTTQTEEELLQRINSYPDLAGSLISEDGRAFSLVLEMNPEVDRSTIVRKAVEVTRQEDGRTDRTASITGGTAMSFFISERTEIDFTILLPLSLLISTLLLYLVFKRKLYVFISLLVICIAVVWTFGSMGWLGVPLSVVTSVIPVILFPIGVADSIHLLKTFSRLRWRLKLPFDRALENTYHELLRPIILTSITTFIGFSSFIFSEISWTRTFGIFTGLGVMLALLFSLLLLPIFLYYEKEHPVRFRKERIRKPSSKLYAVVTHYIFSGPLHGAALFCIVGVAFFGLRQIYFETNPISMFSAESPIVQSDKLISEHFSGTRFFSVVLSRTEGNLTDLSAWEELQQIHRYINEQDAVGSVVSLLPYVEQTSRELTDNPLSSTAVRVLFQNRDNLPDTLRTALSGQINADNTRIRLNVVARNMEDPDFDYRHLAHDIEAHISHNYSHWETYSAGPALITNAMLDLLIRTQVTSLTLAIIFVCLVLILLFRSIKIGFFTTVPILLSTITTYALMGLFGVSINTVTVIVINTCLGIGIDYAIHFTSGFLYYRERGNENRRALRKTVFNKGSVILFNTMVVGAGFLILIFSSFPPIRAFGFFIFVSMIISSIYSIFFLPVLFKNLRYKDSTY